MKKDLRKLSMQNKTKNICRGAARKVFILKKAKVYTVIFMTSILLLSGSPYVVSAESKPAIEALPEKILFHVDNMKPGDCTIQTYTVSNRGRENSEYVLTSQFTRGSKKLYN